MRNKLIFGEKSKLNPKYEEKLRQLLEVAPIDLIIPQLDDSIVLPDLEVSSYGAIGDIIVPLNHQKGRSLHSLVQMPCSRGTVP